MKKLRIEVFFLTVLHMLVDGICSTTIYASLYKDNIILPTIVFIGYNVLAFMMQPLVGFLVDTVKKERLLVLGSLFLVVTGSLLGNIPYLCLLFLGLGNALFHVSAGKITITNSNQKLSLLGVFVSLGVVGLTLGMLYYQFSSLLVILITLTILIGGCYYLIFHQKKEFLDETQKKQSLNLSLTNIKIVMIVGVIIIVMFRGIIGKYTVFNWADEAYLVLLVAIATALGKLLGGVLADKIGITKTILISGLGSLGFLLFARDSIIGGLLGILLFNMTMPITLYLLYKMMPRYEATAFGLAAMVLFPGYVIGMYLQEYPTRYNLIILIASLLTIIFVILFSKEVNKSEFY